MKAGSRRRAMLERIVRGGDGGVMAVQLLRSGGVAKRSLNFLCAQGLVESVTIQLREPVAGFRATAAGRAAVGGGAP